MPFAGLDVHKRVVEAVVLDENGAIRHRERFAATRAELERFSAQHLGRSCRVALEATTNTWSIVQVIKPFVKEVVVSNPLRTRAIAEAKVKTDKVDALVLAQLLRADFLPRVWEPDEPTRSMRQLTSRRASLVGDRTRIKNRIHAVLHQRLISVPMDKLFSSRGLTWLGQLKLDEDGQAFLDSELRLLEQVEAEIAGMDHALAVRAYEDARAKLLMTLPGVDYAIALSLLAALGSIERFKSGDHAAAYLGLVPSTKQSADQCYHGPITKQGRGQARWMVVQAAQHLASHPGPLGHFFRKLLRRKNRNVAVVATARKLVVIAWHMLKNNEPYRYAQPRPTETKLSRLRVRATGVRRKTGPKPNDETLRPARVYKLKEMRRIPPIDEVYEKEGLPKVKPVSRGEQKTLRKTCATKFLHSIHREQIVPRRNAGKAKSSAEVRGGG